MKTGTNMKIEMDMKIGTREVYVFIIVFILKLKENNYYPYSFMYLLNAKIFHNWDELR